MTAPYRKPPPRPVPTVPDPLDTLAADVGIRRRPAEAMTCTVPPNAEPTLFDLYPHQTTMMREVMKAQEAGVPVVVDTGRRPGLATMRRLQDDFAAMFGKKP